MHTRQRIKPLNIMFVGDAAYINQQLSEELARRGYKTGFASQRNALRPTQVFQRVKNRFRKYKKCDLEVRAFAPPTMKDAKHSLMIYHGTDIRDGLFPAEYPCFFTTWDLRKSLDTKRVESGDAVWLPRPVRPRLFEPRPRLPFDGKHLIIGHFPSDPEMDKKYLGKGSFRLYAGIEVLKQRGYEPQLFLPTSTGLTTQDKMKEWYWQCHVVADQFTVGQYGITTLEALLCNRPSVCYVPDDHLEYDEMRGQFQNCTQEADSIADALLSAVNLELDSSIITRLYSIERTTDIFEQALKKWGFV